jgi:hypothetical protein
MELHPWLVYLHVMGAFAFVLGHGASVFAAFRLRGERDPGRAAAVLQVSEWGIGLFYIGLLVLLVAGIAAGFTGNFWGRLWIWTAIVVLAVVIAAMYAIATPYYASIRQALGLRPPPGQKEPVATPIGEAELATLLDSQRPVWLALIGSIGLAVLVWLMLFKPF